jgi:predicted transcriptional regulator
MSRYTRIAETVAPYLLWRPMTASEITERVGMWSGTTIKFALDELVGKGVAIRDKQPLPCGTFRWRYRRSLVRSS